MSNVVRSASRAGFMLGLVAACVLTISASCGTNPDVSADGRSLGPPGDNGCATPQTGCPCTPGSIVACGKHVRDDDNFRYCYEGKRYCEPSGVYGDCVDGTVVPKSMSSGIHTLGLGTPGECAGGETGPLLVCSGGKRQGDFCKTNADCSPGKKKCAAGPDDGKNCKDDSDCGDPGLCGEFNGECKGGTRDKKGCDAAAECPDGTCDINTGGSSGFCTLYVGICKKGPYSGDACNSDADCGGEKCERGHGKCVGGKKNNKKCRHDDQCKGGTCTGEDAGAPTAIDPCDPYCNVVSDTPYGLSPEGGLGVSNGGLYVTGSGPAVVPTAVQTTSNGDQTCGAPNLHTAPCHTGGVIDHSKCQQDFRCDVASNTCVWNGGAGYFDATAGGPDLMIGVACNYSGTGIIPVCNRGSTAVPAGTSIGVNILTAPAADTCAAIGPPTCSTVAPSGGLLPGQCLNITGCSFTGSEVAAVVNAGQRDVIEGPNRCKNNGAAAKNPFAPGCAVCTTCDTRITGKSYAPNGTTPLAGISVFQPAGPLSTLTDGVACDTCASLSSPVSSGATSSADGSFTIYNATPGPNQRLVVQSGRWRRAVNVPITACTTNNIAAASTRLPQTRAEGDIPKTAFVQGNREALECSLLKFGIASSEISRRTGPSDPQRIQLYRVNSNTGTSTGMTTTTGLAPNASGLWTSGGSIDEYSVVVLPCSIEMKEDSSAYTTAADKTRFATWLNKGGRAFMDHWPGEAFIHNVTDFGTTSTWASPLPGSALTTMRGKVNATTPAQTLMRDWLTNVGASTDWGAGWMRSDEPWRHALNPNPANTTEWLRGLSTYTAMTGNQWSTTPAGNFSLSYSFETPLTAQPAPACAVGSGGRVIYNGMHVAQARIAGSAYPSSSNVFPTACQLGPGLSSEELALMYQFFQLTACALGGAPPPPPPPPPPPLASNVVFVRDYEGVCPSGTRPRWRFFQWQATIPTGTSIAFRAATADTAAALPAAPPPGAPATADVGTANATTTVWANDVDTVDTNLMQDTGSGSKSLLRLYMTFKTTATMSPVLHSWRQLFSCVPAE